MDMCVVWKKKMKCTMCGIDKSHVDLWRMLWIEKNHRLSLVMHSMLFLYTVIFTGIPVNIYTIITGYPRFCVDNVYIFWYSKKYGSQNIFYYTTNTGTFG
ncbi:MAG: hypothetical protein CR972_05355 [Candidatus Moraniibacteriota bacterium]|nr:MAG: hypothetical protein CR972_05355 [Candidatus Moranbacteria bacterium]